MLNPAHCATGTPPIPPSPTPNSPHPDSSFKKKQFARKPALAPTLLSPDHRKKNAEESNPSQQALLSSSCPMNSPQPREEKGSKVLGLETSGRQRLVSFRSSQKEAMFYSPKPQNLNYWKDVSYIGENSLKKEPTPKPPLNRTNKDLCSKNEPNNLAEIMNEWDHKKDSGSQRYPRQGHLKSRTSSTTFLLEKDPAPDLINKENQSDLSFVNSGGSKSSKTFTVECFYCKNHKKMADLLNERYQKLQREFTSKLKQNLQLQVFCNNLKIQNYELKKQKDHLADQLQQITTSYQKLGEDLGGKLEGQREEILRLKEKIKYYQIERCILLRLKEDHQVLAKSNLQLKNQHEVMKKTIIATNTLKLNKPNKDKKDPPSTPAPLKASKQPFVFHTPESRGYSEQEDDNLSLDLSEFSQDNM